MSYVPEWYGKLLYNTVFIIPMYNSNLVKNTVLKAGKAEDLKKERSEKKFKYPTRNHLN